MNTSKFSEMSRAAIVFSFAVGISLPSVFIGRSVLAGTLLVALIAYVFMHERSLAIQHLKSLKGHPLTVLALLVLCSWLPQLVGTIDVWISATTVLRTGLLVIGTTILWSGLNANRDIFQCALKAFLVTALILSVLAVISLVAIPELYSIIHGNGLAAVNVARGYKGEAASAALMVPLSLWAGWALKEKWRWMGMLVAMAFLMVIYLTENRASVAGLVGGLLAGAVILGPRLRRRKSFLGLILLVVSVSGGALGWVVLSRSGWAPASTFKFISIVLIDWHRQEIWHYAWSLGADARLFGIGVNIINLLPDPAPITSLSMVSSASRMPLHPHNWVVEVLVETGLFGFATLFSAIIWSFFRFARRFWRHGEMCVLAVTCIWVVYWISGLFNFSYWSAWWQASFYIATAMCLAGTGIQQDNDKADPA